MKLVVKSVEHSNPTSNLSGAGEEGLGNWLVEQALSHRAANPKTDLKALMMQHFV